MEKDVLFGGAASEMEILEFRAGGNSYGVDVREIKEILTYGRKSTPIPNSHPFIEGMIMPRDFLIPIINFGTTLKLTDSEENKYEMLIVSSINDLNIAIHVDSVCGIHKIVSSDITKPGKKLTTSQKDVIMGILTRDEKKIEIVNLRMIINNINPEVNVG